MPRFAMLADPLVGAIEGEWKIILEPRALFNFLIDILKFQKI
jgi:hypothetical protein